MNLKKLIIQNLLILSLCISWNYVHAQDVPTTAALPKGMKLVWADEFNGKELDRTKWSTNYYSSLDFLSKTNYADFKNDNLPQPHMEFTGSSLILKVDNDVPERAFWESGRKISSIQTYDWGSDENHMPNNIGGYFEARIRRNAIKGTKGLNIAFWFDSPGPDLRYFLENKGHKVSGVQGIRPRGQVFEIDLCEMLNTEIVLHGNVSTKGQFDHNIGHYKIPGNYWNQWVTHGMLWTPAGLKFYIDGKLVAESWDQHDIKSPNHAMVMFFGAYGYDGMASIEIDYARHYQWILEAGNELPNPGFEYGLFPWEGSGNVLGLTAARSGAAGLVLNPGQTVYQYVYVDPDTDYDMSFFGLGKDADLYAEVCNIRPVSGEVLFEGIGYGDFKMEKKFKESSLSVKILPDHPGNKSTVRITFTNKGTVPVYIDDVSLTKKQAV